MSEHDALDALAEADYARLPATDIHGGSKAWHMIGYRHGYRDAIRHGNAIGDVVGALHRAVPVMERFTAALEEEA